MSFKEIANSGLIWTLVIISIILVAVITMYYYFLCRRHALKCGLSKEAVNAARKILSDLLPCPVSGHLYRSGFSGRCHRSTLRLVQAFCPGIAYL